MTEDRAQEPVLATTATIGGETGGFLETWRTALADRRFRTEAIVTGPALYLVLAVMSRFLVWVEDRAGLVMLYDPVLALFEPRDLSPITFTLVYGGILFGLVVLARHPRRLVRGLQAYGVLTLFRMLSMYLVPLDSPAKLIPLRDYVIENFGPGKLLQHDLFFSGHTSVLVLLTLAAPGPRSRRVLFVTTLAVAVGVLLQHAHYTIDVVVAPFAAWAAFSLRFPRDPARLSALNTRL